MRKALPGALALALGVALAGCGGKHENLERYEQVIEEEVALLNELASVLETVKDKKTAEAAEPKVEAIGKKFNDLRERAGKLGKLSRAKYEGVEKKYRPEWDAAMKRLNTVGEKLHNLYDALDLIEPRMAIMRTVDEIRKDLRE